MSTQSSPSVLLSLQAAFNRAPLLHYTTAGGLDWGVRDSGGAGASLVLLPGSLGTADIFFHQIEAFGQSHRCLTVDYPSASATALADGLAELLGLLNVARAHLLGASLAGYWLQHFAARHPQRAAGVVLANTFCDSDELSHHPLFNVAALRASTGEEVKANWLASLEARPPGELRDIQIVLLRNGQSGDVLRSRLLAAATAEPSPIVPLSQDRIAIIDCEDDPLLAGRTRDKLAERHPEARRLTLPIGGHYPHVTQAQHYNTFLKSFLARETAA